MRRKVLSTCYSAVFIIWITTLWWPEVFGSFQVFGDPFWKVQGSLMDWILPVWFIFVWGIGVNVLSGLKLNVYNPYGVGLMRREFHEPTARQILTQGTFISLLAGVVEELAFRWILYLSAIVMVVFANWLWGTVFAFVMLVIIGVCLTLFVTSALNNILLTIVTGLVCIIGIIWFVSLGCLDPVKWFYEVVLIPLADFTTFGYLHDHLVTTGSPDAWALGAGVVSANAFFRDGHKYQGLLGGINAWFIGMVLFWVMFTFGLVPAIVVHFIYDLLIFATVAFMRLFR